MAKRRPKFPKIDDVIDQGEFAFGPLRLTLTSTGDPNTLLLHVVDTRPVRHWVCRYAWKVTECSLLPRTEQCNENQRVELETEIRRSSGWQALTPSYLIHLPTQGF